MSDGVSASFDYTEFQKALGQYLAATEKSTTEMVNKKAGDVCLFAARATKSTTVPAKPSKKRMKMYHAIATGNTKFGKSTSGSAVKGKGNAAIAAKILNKRRAASSYSKAIFVKMAGDLGKLIRSKKSTADMTYAKGTPAKKSVKPVAKLKAEGLEDSHLSDILNSSMQAGIDGAVRDMRVYFDRKQAAVAKRFSGRKRR